MRRQQLGRALEQLASHGHDLPAVFCIGNEQVRTHQAFMRVLPAHQDLDTGPAVIAAAHHRLKERHELIGFNGALQFGTRRTGPAQLPVTGCTGYGAEYDQQQEHGQVLTAHLLSHLALAESAVNREGIAR
ncbi:hypothetical protein D3C77_490700 [compost metagenome]